MRGHDLEASSSLTHFTYTAVQLPSMRTWRHLQPRMSAAAHLANELDKEGTGVQAAHC